MTAPRTKLDTDAAWLRDAKLMPWRAAPSLHPAAPIADSTSGEQPVAAAGEDRSAENISASQKNAGEAAETGAWRPSPTPRDPLAPAPSQRQVAHTATVRALPVDRTPIAPQPRPSEPAPPAAARQRHDLAPVPGDPSDRPPGSCGCAPDLSDLVRHRGDRPTCGWRALVFTATSGLINPGPSPAEADRRQLVSKIRTHLAGWHTVTVSSMKGGIGKTTVTAGLGLTLADYRGDRIVALDANPDAGTLADRLTGHCGMTVRDLITNLHTIGSWTDMAHYTSLAGRLQVLASEQDPAMSEAFSRAEYEAVRDTLVRFYNVVITDSGTGLVHSAMGGALDGTKTLVIAGAPTVDGASRASKTLDWLEAHGYGELVRRAVVALSCDRSSRMVDRERVREHFRSRCHAVVEIPADPRLSVGGLIDLDALRVRTRDAFLELAACVAEQFAWPAPARQPTGEARAQS